MDVREKLVELLDEAEEWADHKCDELDCETCPADKMKGNCVQQLMVDRLIAHGVTVQECGHWEDDHGDYVCSCCHTTFTDDIVWLVRGESNEPNYCPNCGAKMMPQPPKGE